VSPNRDHLEWPPAWVGELVHEGHTI
jgi:hypothetical protein